MRVYVSSTYLDLVECRQVVNTTLRKLRQDDVAMEYYVAEPERPVDVCLRDVRESELYIGLFAWRYGHIPDGYTQSITELEYRAAVDAGIPCLVFLLHDEAMWPRNMVDRGAAADKIEALRTELAEKHTVAFFSNPLELGTAVATAVSQFLVRKADIPGEVHQLDPNVIRQYFERLRQQYGGLDLDALTPPEREEYLQIRLESVFVEQYVREEPPPIEVPRELLQRLLAQGEIDEDELPEGFDMARLREAQEAYRAKPQIGAIEAIEGPERRVVILGDPGSGKSTLARYLVLSLAGLAEGMGRLAGHLPLLIELKRYVAMREEGLCGSILEFLDHLWNAQGLGISRQELDPYLADSGPVLAVFDGLDEVFESRQREEITGEIAGFAVRFPSVRIVVTSRIAGYRRALLTNAGFPHYTLQDLDENQIAEFLRTWYSLALNDRPDQAGNLQARLLLAVRESRPIAELAGNPLLLTILAIIGKHQALPRERWRVYDHAARVLVQHWDINRQLQEKSPVAQYIGEDDKREMLRRLAWSMQTAEAGIAGNFIHRQDLQRSFEEYLTERYASDPSTAKLLASRMIEQFRERNFILSRYGPDIYGFVHRAFLEFFCADSIVQRFQRLQVMSLEELTELFDLHAHDDEWREVLRLITSVLAEHHTSSVIDQLLRLDRPWPVERFDQRPPRGLALAVECLADVGNPRAVESASALLNEIVLLLEHGVDIEDSDANDLLEAQVIPAATSIGTAWPDRDAFAAWYARRGCQIVWSPLSTYIARLAASVLADQPEALLPLATTAEVNDRRAESAVQAGITELLARLQRPATTGGNRPDTSRMRSDPSRELFDRLHELTNAERGLLRAVGMAILGLLAPADPRTDAVLRERLHNDTDDDVFRIAAHALLRSQPQDPRTRQTILDRSRTARGDRSRDMLRTLAEEHWPNDPEFWLLRTLRTTYLLDDTNIADAFADLPDDMSTGPFVDTLLTMATDDDYRARHNAIAVLDRLAPDDPRVEDILRDRLLNDIDNDVFRVAANALLRRHPDDPAIPVLRAVRTDELFDDASTAGVATAKLPTEAVVDTLFAMSIEQNSYHTRHNAIAVLDLLAPDDPRVEDILRDRLLNDTDDDVFRAAANALLRRHPDDPRTRQTILDRFQTVDNDLWRDVLRHLTDKYWPNDPEFRVLRTVHMTEPLDDARATEAIAELPTEIPTEAVVETLFTMTVEENSGQARHNALTLLTLLAPDDPRLDDVLEDRLLNDTDDYVFRAAADALLRRHPRDLEFQVMRTVRSGVLNDAGTTEAIAQYSTARPTESLVDALRGMTTEEGNGYQTRHNAIAVLDLLAPDDPTVDDILRDRLLNDTDDDVFRAAANALLRRHPDDPQTRQAVLDRSGIDMGDRWRAMLRTLADEHWPNDPEFETPMDNGPWGEIRRQVNHGAVDVSELPALDHPGPQNLPMQGFMYH